MKKYIIKFFVETETDLLEDEDVKRDIEMLKSETLHDDIKVIDIQLEKIDA